MLRHLLKIFASFETIRCSCKSLLMWCQVLRKGTVSFVVDNDSDGIFIADKKFNVWMSRFLEIWIHKYKIPKDWAPTIHLQIAQMCLGRKYSWKFFGSWRKPLDYSRSERNYQLLISKFSVIGCLTCFKKLSILRIDVTETRAWTAHLQVKIPIKSLWKKSFEWTYSNSSQYSRWRRAPSKRFW